jgi:tetratricopeptide (TPR) repeat protein
MWLPMNGSMDAKDERGTPLESWKAIAAYLGRDVTTVQRWERSEGLPVHRLVHSKAGSVYAYAGEIDQWRRRRSRLPAGAVREGVERESVTAAPEATPTAADAEPAASQASRGAPLNGSEAATVAPAAGPAVGLVASPQESANVSPLATPEVPLPKPRRWLAVAAGLALSMVAVAGAMLWRSAFGTSSTPPAASAGPTEIPSAAHEEYLRGRHLLTENRLESAQQSIRHFQAALKVAPFFAPAYAGLASAHTDLATIAFGVMPPEDALPRALAAARQAVTLDPTLAEGYSVLGRALVVEYRWAEAGDAYAKALELNPSDARTHMWYAEWLLSQHRVTEALEHADRGVALDPLSMRIAGERGMTLYFSRRYDEAIQQTSTVLAVEPDHLMARWMRGNARVQLRQFADGIADLERAVATSGRSSALVGSLAAAFASAGRREDALRLVEELEARRRREYVPATALAPAYAALGQPDRVVACFEETIRRKGNGVHLTPANPMYDSVRTDPGFVLALQKVGLRP